MNSFNKNSDYYRQLIVEHYSNPFNKGLLKVKNSFIFHHYSNSCVDDFYFELIFIKNNIVTNARFEGIGCAISTSSIDIFASLIINKSIDEIILINKNYQAMLKNQEYDEKILKDLIVFKNVLKQPNRIKCALIVSESISEIFLIKQGKK